MSTKPASDNLPKYLAIGGALGLAYLAISYLTNPTQKSSSKTVNVETIRSILKEVKYQVYASCIPYSEGVEKKLKAYPKKDVEIYLRTELAKAYEAKEDLILVKYQVSKDELTLALNAYHKDKQIKKDTEEIFKVLEETVRGQIDLSVPEPAFNLYSPKDLVRVYHEMCVDIGVAVWQKLMECIKNNPAFNAKDDAHFRKAMRELGIYEFKVAYLANRGFKPEWGCPNFVFLKLLENTKKGDLEVRTECFYIEKGYEEIITKISANPENYNKTFINRIMDDTINKLKNPVKVPVQPNPVVNQPPRQQVVQQQAPKPVVQPSKPVYSAPPMVEEDEFDMEKLMLQELLSRSQQAPKEQPLKKAEAPVAVEIKPEPVVRVQEVEQEQVVLAQPEPVVEIKEEEVHEVPVEHVVVEPIVQIEQLIVSVVEQFPLVADEPAIAPKAEEEAVIENLLKEATHSVEAVILQEEQHIQHVQAPVQIPEEPVAEQQVVEEPVQAEPQVQEPEVIHNVEAVQELVEHAEIAVEQQVLPQLPIEQPAEQHVEEPVAQHVEKAVEQPEKTQQVPEHAEEQEYVREN